MLIEPLENRALLAITVDFDYSFDSNEFFNDFARRDVLEAAVNEVVSRLGDRLSAITPGGGNLFEATTIHPSQPGDVTVSNVAIAADTLIVYVGAQSMASLAIAGPAFVNATGTAEFTNAVETRGQLNTAGSSATDFGPIGGSISFDLDPNGGWYFGTDLSGIGSQNDFYSAAMHEMAHVLGLGTSPSWNSRKVGLTFSGPASVAEYDGLGNVPLSSGGGHWASGTTDEGLETSMDPDLVEGTRKTFTPLDFAGLDDVGWELPLSAELDTTGTRVVPAGTTTTQFNITYSHYRDIDVASIGTGDLTVTGPNSFSGPGSFVGTSGSGRSITVTYAVDAPGGSFDVGDVGSYTVSLNDGAVGDSSGNTTLAGSLGSFSVDVDVPPIASLSATGDITLLGGTTQVLTVTYTDSTGIDETTIDLADLTVTRDSDGLALMVSAINITGDAAAKTVTYTVAAPGGTWDVTDNGTYTVSLAGQQVRDILGTPADAATLGSFEVSINPVEFSAGNNLAFTDSGGDLVTVILKGPGSGQVFFTGPDNADIALLVLSGTTSSSVLTLNAAGAGTPIGGLDIEGPLRSVIAKNADLAGEMAASGALSTVQFRNATGMMTLSGTGAPISLTLARASDFSFSSASPIKSIKAGEWLDTDATPDSIDAPTVSAMTIKGAMQADITAGTIGKVTVAGALSGAAIRAAGAIGSIAVGSVSNSILFAGVRPEVVELPDSIDDFSDSVGTIKSLNVRSKAPGSFSNTRVAAANLGKAALGAIDTSNGESIFGVAALTIRSVGGITEAGGPLRRSNLDDPASSLAVGDFAIRLL